MASSTVEDYVKAIYLLQADASTGEATVAGIAAMLGVTKGTVTSMVRKLRESGLANAERYGGVTLTGKGTTLALDMIRRHRLIEVFLVEVLGLDWAEVHEEAERLEHAMSRKVLDRLDAFLGRPVADPHGDPIPDRNGRIARPVHLSLGDMNAGDCGVIARIGDQDPSFLSFAAEHGLRPGQSFRIHHASEAGDAISLEVAGHPRVSLSKRAAHGILVRPSGPS